MDKEIQQQIKTIKEQIKKLPKGTIVKKKIKGNTYFYHQFSQNGKLLSVYLKEDEYLSLMNQIDLRKELERELKELIGGGDLTSTFCTLMHKDSKVVDLFIDNNNGTIIKVENVHNNELAPIGTLDDKKRLDPNKLRAWWNERSIPTSRSGIKEAMSLLETTSLLSLVVKCFGFSLSDSYWIKPFGSSLTWEDNNFFENDFSSDIGNVLFHNKQKNKKLNYSSPDSTSVGNLQKRWSIFDDERVLIKGGSKTFRQEPINEVVASMVARELEIPSVRYMTYEIGGLPYSVCVDFVKPGEDFVSAFQVVNTLKRSNNDSLFTHFVKCCEYLKIENYQRYLNRLLVLDFIIANEDRHLNNFGFIRNVEDKRAFRPAPIFDSGGSFGFDKQTSQIFSFDNIVTKPFKTDLKEQLSLVSDFSWIKIPQLEKIKEIISKTFSSYESPFIDKERINKIVDSASKRIDYLIGIIK